MWMNSIHWTAFYSLTVVVYVEKYALLLIQCAYTLLNLRMSMYVGIILYQEFVLYREPGLMCDHIRKC